jgi:putative transcriptional regulator
MKPLFINQIRVFRAKSNLSQEELANKVEVRRETIGNLEAGKYNPSLLLAMDIAAVFGVTVEDVFQKIQTEEK